MHRSSPPDSRYQSHSPPSFLPPSPSSSTSLHLPACLPPSPPPPPPLPPPRRESYLHTTLTTPSCTFFIPYLPTFCLLSYLPQPILRTTRHNLAGPIQTVSLSDKQHDYFLATRTSPTTYTLSLTSDPTPLYRIEISPSPASDPAIQLFDFHDPFPLAAARMPPFVTTFASVCTREPAGAGAVWHRMTDSHGVLAVEIVPGLPVVNRDVVWSTPRLTTGLTCTLLGSLFGWDGDGVTLARYGMTGPGFRADMVFDILRGGGIEFELGIVMQVFVKLEADRRKLEKKGKGKGKKGM